MAETAASRRKKSSKATEDEAPIGRLAKLKAEAAKKEAEKEPYVLTEDIIIDPIGYDTAMAIANAQSNDEVVRIVLGDQYEDVMSLFKGGSLELWREFQRDFTDWLWGVGTSEEPGGSSV